MFRRAALVLPLAALPALASAQDRPSTMIVLDGSGSMWGQVEGINKIVTAREVLGTLLGDLPADDALGLTVYGHRERGNCADIETVVPAAPGTAEAIRAAADAINPRGKTPMTDAVVAAAESLRHTEEAATVILVSDGVETCAPDPCAAARALEETGVDFTVHVVGFDVTEPEALRQMRCLAEETGGTFTTAAGAAELADALRAVTVEAPEPEPATITLSARMDGEDGPLAVGPVFWTVGDMAEMEGNPVEVALAPGSHVAEAYLAPMEATASRQFVATEADRAVAVVFETPAATATLSAPDEAVAGTTIEVGWTGPGAERDFVGIRAPGAEGFHRHSDGAEVAEGNPVAVTLPIEPGDYVLEYVSGTSDRPAIGARAITVTPAEASVSAPETASAGSTIEVAWTGPDNPNDFIAVRAPDAEGFHRFLNESRTAGGGPARLLMPTVPGTYVIEYVAARERAPVAAATIAVIPVKTTLDFPATAPAGSIVAVAWTGPGESNDFVAVRAPDAEGFHRFANSTRVADGSPVDLLMPSRPGTYLVEYVAAQDRRALQAAEITVTPVSATVTAPAEAAPGAEVEVAWTGPAYRNDFVAIRRPDAEGFHRFEAEGRVSGGSPVTLRMPDAPGEYVVEYIEAQDRTPLAAVPITLR